MTPRQQAQKGYQAVQKGLMSDKAIELRVFMSVTAQLKAVADTQANDMIKKSEAVLANLKLWKIIFLDVVNPNNELPLPLKQQIISLAEFSDHHGRKVLLSEAEVEPLIDINTAIIAGLRQALNESSNPQKTEAA